MSFQHATSKRLTTREAAALTGRSQDAVKTAIRDGKLHGERELDGWRVTQEDLLAWNARTRRVPSRRRAWEPVAQILEEHGSASAEEMAVLADIHPGSARKYLVILANLGRAERLPDGQWVLTGKSRAGAA
jgi:hypothetical protein